MLCQDYDVRGVRMAIFENAAPSRDLWPEDAERPWQRVDALFCRFEEKFPEIRFEVFWETRVANAQAFLGPHGKTVRLYGGLGRHRRVGVAGLALTLAHEAGHHLASGARHPSYFSLASEERAHEWAVEYGLPAVFGQRIASRLALQGKRQLQAIWVLRKEHDSIDPFT